MHSKRAFNMLGQPELRACYDTLLADPETPAIFPYGGFGSLLVSGECSRDGQAFFAHRILAFSPEQKRCRFHLPLRQFDFYHDRALCRDIRCKLELWFDPALLHVHWDPTWNECKHLLGTKIEVDATFVQSSKYRKHGNAWELVRWETTLSSRLAVQLPADFQQQLEAAKTTYRRFGDVAQISWRPDYDPFFYRQLSRRARRIYLFRGEYIFDLEKAVVVETPQPGHATYVFAKPRSMEGFLALYTRIPKEDIRRNQDNIGTLGFLGTPHPRQQSRSMAQGAAAAFGGKDRLRIEVEDSHTLIETTCVPRIHKAELLKVEMMAELVAEGAEECAE